MSDAELDLLERVLLRLGCADTDEQLQNAVTKFLAPVLLKITSPNEAVRLKVMEVLTHISKRLKTRPMIQVPMEPLLEQYHTTESSFAINFTIIYITLGFPRLPIEKQTELAPILINCLEKKPAIHQDKLLLLVLPLLGSIKIPDDPDQRHALLGLSDKPMTKTQLIALLLDVLLLPYGVTAEGEIPPGMSVYSFKRVIVNNWKADVLEELKKGIVRFLCSGVFPEMDALVPLIVASADTRFSVATPAIAELSKCCPSLDWTDPQLSAPLYTLFSGNGSKTLDRKTSACSVRVRQKLLQYLLKCRGRGINTVKGIQVIFEALFGETTNQKCKVLTLQFTEHLIKDGPEQLVNQLSKVLLSGIVKLIGKNSTESYDVQSAAYCAAAQLARTCPDAVNKDLQIVVSHFSHLAEASTELHTPIREALVATAPAFSWQTQNVDSNRHAKFVPNANQTLLLAMLAEHAESKSAIVQNVCSVFLTVCFPQYFVPARYLLLIIAGERQSLRESITAYLYGVTKKDHVNYAYLSSIDHDQDAAKSSDNQNINNKTNSLSTEQRRIVLPSFVEMVSYTHQMAKKRALNPVQCYVHAKVTLPYSFDTYTEILEYLRHCLWYSAGSQSAPGDTKLTHLVAAYLKREMGKSDDMDNPILKYIELIQNVLRSKRSPIELSCLLDLLNAAPDILTEKCITLTEIFSQSLKDVTEGIRNLIAKLYGILIGHGSDNDVFDTTVKDLSSMSQRSLEHQHGCLLAAGHAFYRKIKVLKDRNEYGEAKLQSWSQLKATVHLFVSLLSNQQPLLVSAGIKGLSYISSVTVLPLPDDKPKAVSPPASSDENKMDVDDDAEITKLFTMERLFKLFSSGNAKQKLREDAAHCLGHLALGDGEFFTKRVLQGFLDLIRMTRDAALHIAVGQALVFVVKGSSHSNDEDGDETKVNPHCDDAMFEWLLNEIIKVVPTPNANSRQACAIWLLAIVKNCSKRPCLKKRRQILQFAFTELLAEDNELVQDVASRGLGVIFSLSDADNQSDLANSLLDQLTGGRRQVNQVADDTKLFEEGVLGRTPTGSNITTYRELCGLASDLNQPEMIYQFMQLANNNAMWNSKLGAAFGLKSISKVAKVKMQPYLGKIVPRLFRYKYDPTPKIQNSMCSIWDSIVTDSKATVELYYWEILAELTANLTSPEWRTRIACCLAVRDLIKRPGGLKLRSDESGQQQQTQDVNVTHGAQAMEIDEQSVPEPELAELLSQLFRVMDDIHEGTRNAAEGTATALSKVCVVAASSDHGKSGLRVATSILPLILETGVTHTVAEVRALSIRTVSEMIDSAGALLVPHLQELVPCLLRATGELEIAKLSYLSTRFGADADVQEAVDTMRADAAKQHYTMETLTKCIRHIDYATFEKMTPAILEVMKTSVNLGTKIACAHFICLITVRLSKEMTPLVGKYLHACLNGLGDRNAIVRRYNASAIGHLVGFARDQSVIKLCSKLNDFYNDHESDRGRTVPLVIQAINKRHHEILKDYSPHILPLLFFASHEEVTETNKSTVELWKDLWSEISPGDAGIRMNLDVILPCLIANLDNQSWLLKAQSANAIATLATRLGDTLNAANRQELINAVLASIAGRTYAGKERLLQALASLSKHIKQSNDDNNETSATTMTTTTTTELSTKLIDAVMRECRKEEPVYRTHALRAAGTILDQLAEDRFEEVYQMVWYLLDKQDLTDDQENDDAAGSSSGQISSQVFSLVSAEERNRRALVSITLKETVCETLGKAWPAHSKDTQAKYQVLFVEKCVTCLRKNTRPVQLSLLAALGRYVERLRILDNAIDVEMESSEKKVKVDRDEDAQVIEKICKDVLSAVVYVAEIPHTGLKKEALNVVLMLIKRLKARQSTVEMAIVKSTIDDIIVALQKDHAPEVKCRLKDIEEKLKDV